MGAEAGTLTFMVGGAAADLERARPILAAMGRNIFHAGAAGSGQAAKICNNMMAALRHDRHVAEAFALGEPLRHGAGGAARHRLDLDRRLLLLTNYPPVPGLLPNVPSSRDYQNGFASALMLKDLRLAEQAGLETGLPLPMGQLAAAMFGMFCRRRQRQSRLLRHHPHDRRQLTGGYRMANDRIRCNRDQAERPGRRPCSAMLIGGEWCGALAGETIVVENPARREPICTVPRARAADVDRAVSRRRPPPSRPGRARVPRERGRQLQLIADALEPRIEELARLIAQRDGQRAAHPGPWRGPLGGRRLPLFRRAGQRAERHHPAARRGYAELYAARADRGRRRHRALERAGAARRAEDRARRSAPATRSC